MALYSNLTTKQMEVLEPIKKDLDVYKKKYDDICKKLGARIVTADFEENQRLRKVARELKRKCEEKQAEVDNILNAREEYDYCVRKAQSLCKRAESLKKTWDFE